MGAAGLEGQDIISIIRGKPLSLQLFFRILLHFRNLLQAHVRRGMSFCTTTRDRSGTTTSTGSA
jgi:hypothetical protein